MDFGKQHAPANIGKPPPQFTADEIADTPEHQAERNHRYNKVGDGKKPATLAIGEPGKGDHHSDEPAMKRHTTLPDLEQAQRIGQQLRIAIHQHVTNAPADNHTQHAVKQQITDLLPVDRRTGMPCAQTGQNPERAERSQIHQPIPMNLQRTQLQRYRIEVDQQWISVFHLIAAPVIKC